MNEISNAQAHGYQGDEYRRAKQSINALSHRSLENTAKENCFESSNRVMKKACQAPSASLTVIFEPPQDVGFESRPTSSRFQKGRYRCRRK
jgi:hypothetical protein